MGMALLVWLLSFFTLLHLATDAATLTLPMAKPNCSDKCGNITVPYPFGFGVEGCYYGRHGFELMCKKTHHKPPKLFFGDLEVLDISLHGQLHVLAPVTGGCSKKSGLQTYSKCFSLASSNGEFSRHLNTITFSNTRNRFVVLGCNTTALLKVTDYTFFDSIGSRVGSCRDTSSIPWAFGPDINVTLNNINNHTNVFDSSPCSYAFLVDKNWINQSVSDLLNFTNNLHEAVDHFQVPVVVGWAIRKMSCEEAQNYPYRYACGNNSDCVMSQNGNGYSCNCSKGYQGNPYLPHGCQDINECADPNIRPCGNWTCTNLPGSYNCSCPPDYQGDGRTDGIGCIPPQKPRLVTPVTAIGIGLGSLFLLFGSLLVLYVLQKRKEKKLKQKIFKQNGGFLLMQQLSSHKGPVEAAKIYTAEELKQATNNYAQNQILGRGGFGTVYKGILLDHRTVAIKKSKIVDESQIEQFVNEVIILSQINHKNVVKLLGCCLETEVPILVYEFITNKTLFHHIHGDGCNSSISWDHRLRIATETSEALAYLHSTASPPIIHRDVKSANILLDDNYMAKVAYFGASRLVPLDQTRISTLIQGTFGYLDPEYLQSSQLTEKSDVYSFGVVLLEVLTGKKALYSDGLGRETNLAMYFVTSFKEGRVLDLLIDQIKVEGCKEQLQEVLKLAERCLRVKGEERPTMKEVAMELQVLRSYQRHSWISENLEQVECLPVEPSYIYTHNTIGYDSITNEALMSLDGGR